MGEGRFLRLLSRLPGDAIFIARLRRDHEGDHAYDLITGNI
jgi:hypothetical protein